MAASVDGFLLQALTPARPTRCCSLIGNAQTDGRGQHRAVRARAKPSDLVGIRGDDQNGSESLPASPMPFRARGGTGRDGRTPTFTELPDEGARAKRRAAPLPMQWPSVKRTITWPRNR